MVQGEHFSSELGVGAAADEEEFGEEADERVGEAEEHESPSCGVGRTIRA